MKKLLSILLSTVLCASVVITNPDAINLPDVDTGNTPSIEIEFGEGDVDTGSEAEPCDERWPPYGEDI